MNIKNLRMIRTISGHGEQTAMVGRLGWESNGQEHGVEVPCGEEEEDLLEALERCVYEMLKFIDATLDSERAGAAGDDAPDRERKSANDSSSATKPAGGARDAS